MSRGTYRCLLATHSQYGLDQVIESVVDGPHAKAQLGCQLLDLNNATIEDESGCRWIRSSINHSGLQLWLFQSQGVGRQLELVLWHEGHQPHQQVRTVQVQPQEGPTDG